MQLVEVQSKKHARDFIRMPVSIYRTFEHYIRPLDRDISSVFNPLSNKYFAHGACTRFLLYQGDKTIGRIAAFVDHRALEEHSNGVRPGGIGFFECINDTQAATRLFEAAKDWLTDYKINAIDGPINFGDRDKWWGLLTKGYELEPNYQCNYHPPYYKALFEAFGFTPLFNHYTFVRKVAEPFHKRIHYKAEKIKANPDYRFEHFNPKEIDRFTKDIVHVYNEAWVDHDGVAKITLEEGQAIINQLKPILDKKIIWMAYHKNEAVGCYINIPEINQILKYVDGKLNLIGKVKFMWHQWRKTNKKMLGFLFGIVPEHQGKGLDGGLIMATAQMIQQEYTRYEDLEINGIGDFNRKMMLVVKQVGGEVAKIHTTYRYQH